MVRKNMCENNILRNIIKNEEIQAQTYIFDSSYETSAYKYIHYRIAGNGERQQFRV